MCPPRTCTMPAIRNAWAKIADAPDAQVKAYRGLTQNHLAELVRSGVDITAYSEAKRVHHRLNVDSAAEACERAEASYIREKRVLLQAMSGLVMEKVARALEAARTRNVEATQLTKEVGTALQTAIHALQGATTALHSAGTRTTKQLRCCVGSAMGWKQVAQLFAKVLSTMPMIPHLPLPWFRSSDVRPRLRRLPPPHRRHLEAPLH